MPEIEASVGGKGAKNDSADVKVVQELLNKAVINGDLPGFIQIRSTGEVDAMMLRMIYTYAKLRVGFSRVQRQSRKSIP